MLGYPAGYPLSQVPLGSLNNIPAQSPGGGDSQKLTALMQQHY